MPISFVARALLEVQFCWVTSHLFLSTYRYEATPRRMMYTLKKLSIQSSYLRKNEGPILPYWYNGKNRSSSSISSSSRI